MKNPAITPVAIRRYTGNTFSDTEDLLAIEEPLEIRLLHGPRENRIQTNISVTMRTPGHDEELAAGFLFTEGIIQYAGAIESVQQPVKNGSHIVVCLTQNTLPDLQHAGRNFFASAGCGVCGKSSVTDIHTLKRSFSAKPVEAAVLNAGFFRGLQDAIRQQQEVFGKTGGLHAAALFNRQGDLLLLREDIGRHNALDKVIGAAFLKQQVPLQNTILLLSGRAGFELVQKAAMAGITIIAAVGAPSSMAVQTANSCGITLIGFLRDERFNIYSLTERIAIA